MSEMLRRVVMMMKKPSVGTTYRYLRLVFPVPEPTSFPTISEIYWIAGATDYPTVAMTTTSIPAPLVSSDINATVGESWRVFDKSADTGSLGFDPFTLGDGSVTIDLGAGNGIAPTGIGIVTSDTSAKSFLCYGSNNATFTTGQVLLYTSGTVSGGWTSSVRRNFTF